MKTKALLIAAAALAAGVMSSQAQVYSQNIVGYVNLPIAAGYTLAANQLDLDGTGTNNSIYTVVGTNLPAGTTVEAWNGSGYTQSKLSAAGHWVPNNQIITNAMNPGGGFFVVSAVATNVTLVGNVITGTNNYPIVAGYQIASSSSPVTGGITSVLGYKPSKSDTVQIWNGSGYTQRKWSGTTWVGGEPVLSVGESVFIVATSNNVWTQVLNVP